MFNPKLNISLIAIVVVLLIINQFQLTTLHSMTSESMHEQVMVQADQSEADSFSADLTKLAQQILPKGIPKVYGAELGLNFDQAAAAIPVLAPFEQDTRTEKLIGEKLERYIKIGQSISCEFCCGATTMVFPDGRKACGCAHSAAMRGLSAYLLDKQADQMTDQQILTELAKWKAVFFPGPTVEKYATSQGLTGNATPSQGLKQQVGGC